MKLELQKMTDGTGLMIFVTGRFRTIAIPLAHGLSVEIDKMLMEEAAAAIQPARQFQLSRGR